MKIIKRVLSKIFATTYFQPIFEKLHYFSLKGMNYGSANSPLHSGELSVIKLLVDELPKNAVIFDVGANNGQYLDLLLQYFSKKNITIHCFEPDEKAFNKLKLKFGNFKNVVLNNFALGNKEEIATLYVSKLGGVDSSLINTNNKNLEEVHIEVKTLDKYCKINEIHKIDFLKIDTEGFEIHVLEGAATMIENQSIDRIQLEHGAIQSIISQASLYKYLMILKNYSIFHIKQNGIRKMQYAPKNEIYYNSNYYFVKNNIKYY